MKNCVFLDLDGTLWEHEVIPESALEAIEKARKAGHLIFANTGRARSTGYAPLKGLPLNGMIFSAGAEILLDGKRIYFDPMPVDLVHTLMDRFNALDIGYSAEGSERTFANEKNKDFLRHHVDVNRVSSLIESLADPSTMKDEDYQQIMKFSIQIPDLEQIRDLMDEYDLDFSPCGFEMEGVVTGDLTRRSHSKATAIETVRSLMDDPVRTVAIGDADNDIPMLKTADLSIAMGNGTEPAKEAADWVTTSIDDNGLYNAFKHADLFDPA